MCSLPFTKKALGDFSRSRLCFVVHFRHYHNNTYAYGCTIDFSRAEVHKGSEIISLTAKEHTLLETLARNAGKIVTVDALCEALWGDNPFGYENSLNAHVRRVREKIETNPSKPVSLITIKGLGYKLIARK